ncbi:hypothetical protein SDC9_159332 [bioreactor metagenome]|uniref:Uncharacterized protein n=1 Tax=bioreactor metagenome TaxID=1076179 RepID=A0A645FEW5_9ZZZZ
MNNDTGNLHPDNLNPMLMQNFNKPIGQILDVFILNLIVKEQGIILINGRIIDINILGNRFADIRFRAEHINPVFLIKTDPDIVIEQHLLHNRNILIEC